VQKRLGSGVKDINFERWIVSISLLSPNHYWKMVSTKSGPLMEAIQNLKDHRKFESLKKDVLQAITLYTTDNMLRLDFLVTVAIKKERQERISISLCSRICRMCKNSKY